MKTKSMALCLLLATVASIALAQSGPDSDPTQAQGYVDNYFHDTEVDSINQYNGQLTVPIPIGPVYQIGPNLTFQGMLTYNTRLTEPGNPTPTGPTDYNPVAGDPALGIGWNFTAGRIGCGALPNSPTLPSHGACYIRPDGSEIYFGSGTEYKLVHNGTFPNDTYTMWDGDGNRHEFSRLVRGYDDLIATAPGYVHDFGRARDGYYLTSIQDPFGNRLTVTYASSSVHPCQQTTCVPSLPGSAVCPNSLISWVPATFAIQRVGEAALDVFKVITETTPGSTFGRIRALQAKTFAAGVSQFSQWNLSYGSITIPDRPHYCDSTSVWTLTGIGLPADVIGTTGYSFSYYSESIAKGLLKTMSLPTGATIFYDYGSYTFHHARLTYLPPDCTPMLPPLTIVVGGIWRSSIVTDSGAGNGPVVEPEPEPNEPTTNCGTSPYLQKVVGVLERTVEAPNIEDSITTYTQYALPFGETDNEFLAPDAQTLTVALLPADADGVRRAESTLFWGVNHSLESPPLGGGRLGAPLRHAVFESDPNPDIFDLNEGPNQRQAICGSSDTVDDLCATHAIRVTQNIFEYDTSDPTDGTSRRLKKTTTYYGHITGTDSMAADYCPTCLQHTVTYSNTVTCETPAPVHLCDWASENGRHYNKETHTGTLGGDALEITTNWEPASVPNNLLNLFDSRLETDPDVPNPLTLTSTRRTIDRSFFFNTTTGFLNATLSWDQLTTRYFGDCRYPDAAGNLNDEVTANVIPISGTKPTASPCPGSVGSWPPNTIGLNSDAFGQRSLHAGGQLASRRWIQNATPLTWYNHRVIRDGPTGWITASYDTAGLQTTFRYDSLGRVTLITPPGGEAPTTIAYTSPTQTTVSRDGSDDDSWQQFRYDGVGRLIREIRQMPSGYAFRTHDFDAAGNGEFTSEWSACTSAAGNCATTIPSLGTSFSDFDPFGRPQTIAKADGSLTTISFTDNTIPPTPFSDTRNSVTFSNVGCMWNGSSCTGGSSSTTAYRHDAAGRLTRVLEQGVDLSEYSYDVAGKLVSVTQGSHPRTFSYDSLGYLIREETPEAGKVDYTTVSGGTTYPFWGSLGNMQRRVDGYLSTTPVTRSYQYDAAGRQLCEISGTFGAGQTCATGGLTLYVRNFYDGNGFGGGSFPLGKLTQRIGYNRILSPTATVTGNFTYSNAAGRLSQEATSIVNGASSHSATQSWTYDALGLVKTHSHPRASGTFTVTNSRSFGFISAITATGPQNIVNAATYNPSGGLASWTAGNGPGGGNGVVTTITQDGSLLPRPSRVRTTGAVATAAGGDFDSSIYRYDGAGNIAAIGTDLFGHDLRSRLTSANYGATGTQNFSYDRYGNLLSNGSVPAFCTTTCVNNKLAAPFTYDTRGNLKTNGSSETLTYDDLSRQVREQSPGVDWRYLYSGAGERAAKVPAGGTAQYTYRDEGNRIATEYYGATLGRDNFVLGNLLVASFVSSTQAGALGWHWYHSDHLGTPRLVTDNTKSVIESRKYWPYGDGIPGQVGTLQKLRFAAMERDSETSGVNTHYYDHARTHAAVQGRFISPDKIGGTSEDPQTWNRYNYALSNPLAYIDPNGLAPEEAGFFTQVINYLLDRAFPAPPSPAGNLALDALRDSGHDVETGTALAGGGNLTPRLSRGLHEGTAEIGGRAIEQTRIGLLVGMLGEFGVQTTSKTLYNRNGVRLDVENPAPGIRPGQVHVQVGREKHVYDFNRGRFRNARTGELSPNRIQALLRLSRFRAALKKATVQYLKRALP